MEDFRLLYEHCPEIKMVSIEADNETLKRQRFHLPCGSEALRLVSGEISIFLARYQANDQKSIFRLLSPVLVGCASWAPACAMLATAKSESSVLRCRAQRPRSKSPPG